MRLWTVAPLDKRAASEIQTKYSLPSIVAMLLQIRGITSDAEIRDFLYNESELDSPLEIRDMDKAAQRVNSAVDNGELICVYGDYDADGVTSTALLYSYLEAVGANVIYYIPSREGEGYGMNNDAVKKLSEQGVDLIITVDNGIAAVSEIEYAKSLGIDTVVTDHHMPQGRLPDACAVVDMHRADCPSRYKELSGVGVAFKLIMALEGEFCDVDSLLDNYADLLSLGTIGDIVELKSENRVFVKRGLRSIAQTDRAGVLALKRAAGISDGDLSTTKVAFTLVPRINAVGRLGFSGHSVELLLTDDYDEAARIAGGMSEDNTERRRIEGEILREIDSRVRRDPSVVMDRVIVLDGEGWHIGVIGIVASRVRELYGKPTIIIGRDGAEAKGSGRSVEGFPLNEAVDACADLLGHHGGHPMACGLSIESDKIPLFRKRINEFAASLGEMPFDRLMIDCKLNPAYAGVELCDSLSVLEPFGSGNPVPVFGFYRMTIQNIIPLSNNKHVKLELSRDRARLDVLWFGMSGDLVPYQRGETVDVAATLDVNVYNGERSLSVILRDIKASDDDTEALLMSSRVFEKFCRGEELSRGQVLSIFPNREDFAVLYRYLRAQGGYRAPIDTLPHRLAGALSLGKIRVILEAMNELGLIEIREGIKSCDITLRAVAGKVSLESARIIMKLKEALR